MKKIVVACAALMLLNNEVISLGALIVLCCIALIKLFSAATKGGAFD